MRRHTEISKQIEDSRTENFDPSLQSFLLLLLLYHKKQYQNPIYYTITCCQLSGVSNPRNQFECKSFLMHIILQFYNRTLHFNRNHRFWLKKIYLYIYYRQKIGSKKVHKTDRREYICFNCDYFNKLDRIYVCSYQLCLKLSLNQFLRCSIMCSFLKIL